MSIDAIDAIDAIVEEADIFEHKPHRARYGWDDTRGRRHLMCLVVVLGSLWFATFVHAGEAVLRIGDSKGLYKAQLSAAGALENLPYDIEWAEFPATAPALEALGAGAIDVRMSAIAPLIFAIGAGAPLKAVVGVRLNGPRESVAILVPPNSPIHTLADLRGKRIGTNKGSVGHHLVLAALQRDGISSNDVKIQYLMPADAKAALTAGSVDAWSTWEPYVSIAEVEDHLRPIVDGSPLPITDAVIASSNASIAAKRSLIEDFLTRLAKAQAWALQHPEEYARLYSMQTGLPVEVTRSVVRHLSYSYVPIDDAVIHDHQVVANLYLASGVIRQPIDLSAAFDRTLFK